MLQEQELLSRIKARKDEITGLEHAIRANYQENIKELCYVACFLGKRDYFDVSTREELVEDAKPIEGYEENGKNLYMYRVYKDATASPLEWVDGTIKKCGYYVPQNWRGERSSEDIDSKHGELDLHHIGDSVNIQELLYDICYEVEKIYEEAEEQVEKLHNRLSMIEA